MTAYFLSEEAIVDAPVQPCFDLVLAVRRYAEWWAAVRCVPIGSEALLRVGSRVRCSAGALSWTVEGTRVAPYGSVDLCCVEGDLAGALGWDFHPHTNGTRVRHVARGLRLGEHSLANLPALFQSITADAFAGMRGMLESAAADVSGGDLFDTLLTQRAVRTFRPDPIPDAVLREILAAAPPAPSARNAQPWYFLAGRRPAPQARGPHPSRAPPA